MLLHSPGYPQGSPWHSWEPPVGNSKLHVSLTNHYATHGSSSAPAEPRLPLTVLTHLPRQGGKDSISNQPHGLRFLHIYRDRFSIALHLLINYNVRVKHHYSDFAGILYLLCTVQMTILAAKEMKSHSNLVGLNMRFSSANIWNPCSSMVFTFGQVPAICWYIVVCIWIPCWWILCNQCTSLVIQTNSFKNVNVCAAQLLLSRIK